MFKLERSLDGTIKIKFNGYSAIIIPTINNKFCICLSCQIGCAIACSFCSSGKSKFIRNLSQEEILNQILCAKKIIGQNPSSVVFMGVGEPSLNLINVLGSAEIIHQNYNLPYKKITISTVGLSNLESLKNIKFNLAISLHSPIEKRRKKITPLACSISKILKVSNHYTSINKKNYIMIEYTLINGFNDSSKDIDTLLSLNWPKRTLFNLIEFNETNNFKKTPMEEIRKHKLKILSRGYKCFIRNSRGNDIGASCGMLTN
jgi:23S rRNA (adenine2503-C2)-methyltransferase